LKILLLTDGSRFALAAARAITGWFDWVGGEVDVLAVVPEWRKSDHRDFGRETEGAEDWRGTVGRWLDDTVSRLEGSGLRVRRMLREGDPATVAAEVAGDGYDMVAAGARGRGDRPFLSADSVARALLERAPASVFLARERVAKGRAHRLPTLQHPLRVLLATEPHGRSTSAKRFTSRLIPAHVEATPASHATSSDILEAARDADLLVIAAGLEGAQDVAEASACSVLLVREGKGQGPRAVA
jgi:nucleotide-binding universal stress UspA family protein